MKQYITIEQFRELEESIAKKTLGWSNSEYMFCVGNDIAHSVFKIGRMIELIGPMIESITQHEESDYEWIIYLTNNERYMSYELADALWEAVKVVLNER